MNQYFSKDVVSEQTETMVSKNNFHDALNGISFVSTYRCSYETIFFEKKSLFDY